MEIQGRLSSRMGSTSEKSAVGEQHDNLPQPVKSVNKDFFPTSAAHIFIYSFLDWNGEIWYVELFIFLTKVKRYIIFSGVFFSSLKDAYNQNENINIFLYIKKLLRTSKYTLTLNAVKNNLENLTWYQGVNCFIIYESWTRWRWRCRWPLNFMH